MLAELVDELGGLEALAPGPDQEEAEPFSKLDFGRRHLLKLTLLDRWGALLGANDRHLAEFMPVGADRGVGVGCDAGASSSHPWRRREKHQAEFIAEVDAVLAGKEELATWDSGELVAPVIDSLVTGTAASSRSTAPTPGQCPDLPTDAVVESMCVVDADGIRGRDVAPAPGAVRGAAAPSRGRAGDDRRSRA